MIGCSAHAAYMDNECALHRLLCKQLQALACHLGLLGDGAQDLSAADIADVEGSGRLANVGVGSTNHQQRQATCSLLYMLRKVLRSSEFISSSRSCVSAPMHSARTHLRTLSSSNRRSCSVVDAADWVCSRHSARNKSPSCSAKLTRVCGPFSNTWQTAGSSTGNRSALNNDAPGRGRNGDRGGGWLTGNSSSDRMTARRWRGPWKNAIVWHCETSARSACTMLETESSRIKKIFSLTASHSNAARGRVKPSIHVLNTQLSQCKTSDKLG